MLSVVIRFSKRFVVLVPGLFIAYLSIFDIFPWFHDHLPLALAIFVTYVLGAYLFIPAIIRVIRIFIPARHLPLYCVTPDGFASDPINLGIIGRRQDLIDAMAAAGWFKADEHSARNVARQVLSTFYRWNYPEAPMSNLYLFGRKQDLGFELPIPGGVRGSRHHVRFWAATYTTGKRLHARSIHWQNRQAHVNDDRLLWVGAASRDIGISLIRHNAQITHMIDPDTNSERALIVDNLRDAKRATLLQTVKLGAPYQITNRVWRGYLQSDGRMAVLEITPNQGAATVPQLTPLRSPATES